MNAVAPYRQALEPVSLTEAMQFAAMLAKSSMIPKDFIGRPENVLVAIQWGREVGLGPMQALQNIAVINGRPSIWGDAALALVKAHPACEDVIETLTGEGEAMVATCEVRRRGKVPVIRTFSVADAKKAGLWGKGGPWTQYPRRMLPMRARGFALRDSFPDALRGVITAEEAMDLPAAAFQGTTLDHSPAPAVAAQPATDVPTLADPPAPDRAAEWTDAMIATLHAAGSRDEVQAIITKPAAALNKLAKQRPELSKRITEAYNEALNKQPSAAFADDAAAVAEMAGANDTAEVDASVAGYGTQFVEAG